MLEKPSSSPISLLVNYDSQPRDFHQSSGSIALNNGLDVPCHCFGVPDHQASRIVQCWDGHVYGADVLEDAWKGPRLRYRVHQARHVHPYDHGLLMGRVEEDARLAAIVRAVDAGGRVLKFLILVVELF